MDYKEWLGYIASLIVLISLLMSSVKKLRWINLLGSLTFAVYGFLINALPVAVMNAGIVGINIATGASVEEAAQRLREAIAFHIEGLRSDGIAIAEPTSCVEYIEIAA